MEIIEAVIGMENEIIELQRRCYRESAERYYDYSIAPLTETSDDLLQVLKDTVILVAIEEGVIIGSIRGNEKGGTCRIGRVIVHPRRQNQGVGKSLMDAIEARFANAERYELFTGHLDAKNLHFYERHGYRPFKTEKLTDALSFVYLEKAGNQSPRI